MPLHGGEQLNVSVVGLTPQSGGGLSIYRNLNLNTTGQLVRNGAANLYAIHIYNNAGQVRYIKLFDKGTAPVLNTDTPVMTLAVAGSGTVNVINLSVPLGINFNNGIGIGASSGPADQNTGTVNANDIICDLFYK